MIRLWLRWSALAFTACALLIGAILAQPRDDTAMRAFFAPGDCGCFLGIHPGVTTPAQAYAILSAQPWVRIESDDADSLSWTWNGKQPTFVSDYAENFLLARVDFQNGVVSAISIPTTTTWAEFYFLFGEPDRAVYIIQSFPSFHNRIYDAAYFHLGFEVETTTRCPVTSREAVWDSTVFITWPVSGPVLSGQPILSQGC